jgi:hypothetical protein
MDYEKLPKEWSNFLLVLFIISALQLTLFLNKIYYGGLFVLFLLFCLFFFVFLDNKSKKEELESIIKLRENRTRYLFKKLPEEFP